MNRRLTRREYLRAMAREDRPFFLYIAQNAPHWPLHARPEDINRYRGTYRRGWQALSGTEQTAGTLKLDSAQAQKNIS